jgi:hypothetical protein
VAQFELLLEALEPQRYFIFCFETETRLDPKVVRSIAGPVVRTKLVSLALEEDLDSLSIGAAHALQRDLSTAFQSGARATLGRNVVVPDDNLFSGKRSFGRRDPFVRAILEILKPLQNGARRANDYQRQREALDELLEGAAIHAALGDGLNTSLEQIPQSLPEIAIAITSDQPFDSTTYVGTLLDPLSEGLAAVRKAKPALAKECEQILSTVDALDRLAKAFGAQYDQLQHAASVLLDQVELDAREVFSIAGHSVLTEELSRNAYVSMDTGVAYLPSLATLVFYSGVNIYFRPVNKAAPLRYKGSFGRRFAMTVGLTTSVKDDARRAADLRGDSTDTNCLLLGGGLRITPALRVGGGVVLFKEADPNPLITKKSVAATPYFAMAFDIDVAALLKRVF